MAPVQGQILVHRGQGQQPLARRPQRAAACIVAQLLRLLLVEFGGSGWRVRHAGAPTLRRERACVSQPPAPQGFRQRYGHHAPRAPAMARKCAPLRRGAGGTDGATMGAKGVGARRQTARHRAHAGGRPGPGRSPVTLGPAGHPGPRAGVYGSPRPGSPLWRRATPPSSIRVHKRKSAGRCRPAAVPARRLLPASRRPRHRFRTGV